MNQTKDLDEGIEMLRHTLATLAYRAAKVLREVPPDFGETRCSPSSRSATEILSHMADLMAWGREMAGGRHHWEPDAATGFEAAEDRFFDQLSAFDAALVDGLAPGVSGGTLFQGPIADALTHVGQLALMRGLSGAPVRPENYVRAEIRRGEVGRAQSAPKKEFDGDASRYVPRGE